MTHLLRTLGTTALFERAASGERPVAMHAKRLALLIFLARGGRGPSLRRDVLLALLWPDADQEHGRGALRQTLSGLRKQLGPGALVTRGEEEVGLVPGVLACDATEFEQACAEGNHGSACNLYQGDFAAGFHVAGLAPEFQQWMDGERDRLRRLAVLSARGTADEAERAGRPTEAATWARRAVALAPDDEAGVAHLIGVLDRCGDRSGALAAYNQLEQHLAAEYSAEPSPETRALIQAVRARQGQHRSAIPPETSEVVDDSMVAVTDAPAGTERLDGPPRRKLFLAGAIGAVLMLAFAATSAWIGRPALPASEVVAVMPFRISAGDSALGWLHEGMVELLTIRLTGEGGMRIVEPGRLLTAWHRAVPPGRTEVPETAQWKVAAGVGAGRIIAGSVTGTTRSIGLGAWVLAPGGGVVARASVEGSPDSLPWLVDQLAAQLLGLGAGMGTARLASFTRSLPAFRSFLAGRAAFRAGRMEEAQRGFREAIDRDSSFALAGLELYRASTWTGSGGGRGWRIANAGRNRLTSADRAWLDVMRLQWINAPVMFAKWNEVTRSYPDRPETWYGLGDAYYHWGALAGIEDFLNRAEEAFRRGWILDSTVNRSAPLGASLPLVAEPTIHLMELAHIRGDTATVRRLATRVLAADSSSDLALTLRWHLAVVEGDSARRVFWDGIRQASLQTVGGILRFVTWTGIGASDMSLAVAESQRRLRAHDPGPGYNVGRATALNGGRLSEVPSGEAPFGYPPREALRSRIRQALSWQGDSAAAREAAVALSRHADGPLEDTVALRAQYQDICTVGQWRTAHGDLAAGEVAARRLRAARAPEITGADSASFVQVVALCAALLDATRASALARPDAHALLTTADSLARTYIQEVCCGEAVNDANLLLARLWEHAGERALALRALRRRAGGFMVEPLYLSTFLREEGRLSALTGDTASAVRAYRHYLVLRYDPEPSARPEVERVRRDLAALSPRVALGR